MHYTAQKLGRLFFEQYWSAHFSIIVELGSYDFNGTLRKFQPKGSSWIGLDIEPGPSVDICVKAGDPLPIESESADAVLATSVFEHDEASRWMTSTRCVGLREAGRILYINAPSNGGYHRYPQDCWRFYPDAANALEKWARAQGMEISVCESFVANREADIWNDFVASRFWKVGPISAS